MAANETTLVMPKLSARDIRAVREKAIADGRYVLSALCAIAAGDAFTADELPLVTHHAGTYEWSVGGEWRGDVTDAHAYVEAYVEAACGW